MTPVTPGQERPKRSAIVLAGCLLALVAPSLAPQAGAAEPEALREVTLTRLKLGAAAGLPGSALAAIPGFEPTGRLVPDRNRRIVTFYDTHLLPQLNKQFNSFQVYENMPGMGQDLEEFALHREVTRSAEASAVRGATKALRDFAIDLTPANRWLSTMPRPSAEVRSARSGASLGFTLGISHSLPELGLRYRVGRTSTRIELDSTGEVDMEFMHSAAAWTRVSFSYNPRGDWYGVHCRFAF